MPLRVVVIETAGTNGAVAVADAQQLLASRDLTAARRHARDLAPALEEMLAERDWRPSSIDLVLVDIGPGSYTGLRVGITTAKTLAYATGAAVLGVDGMSVLAENAPPRELDIAVAVDAQQNRLYVARFRRESDADPPELVEPTRIVPAGAWIGSLPSSTFVTGPGVDRIESSLPAERYAADRSLRRPNAEALFRVGMRSYRTGRRDDPWTLEPSYLRASSAEEKWDRKREQSPSEPADPIPNEPPT